MAENKTLYELDSAMRMAATAAYNASHGHAPDYGFAPDRAWIEGWACATATQAVSAPAADALDAARYRYLRDEHIGDDPGSINLAPARKRGLDSAIDAAIAAQAAAQGGA